MARDSHSSSDIIFDKLKVSALESEKTEWESKELLLQENMQALSIQLGWYSTVLHCRLFCRSHSLSSVKRQEVRDLIVMSDNAHTMLVMTEPVILWIFLILGEIQDEEAIERQEASSMIAAQIQKLTEEKQQLIDHLQSEVNTLDLSSCLCALR